MKRILGPVLGAALVIVGAPAMAAPAPPTSPAAKPLDPASLAVARQILTIAFPPEKRAQLFTSVMNSMVDQSRKAMQNSGFIKDKDFEALVDQSTRRMYDQLSVTMNAALPDYFESFAHAYARDFSLDDLKAILAFVKTPAGNRYFQRAPLLLQDPDVLASNQHMMAQIMAKAPEIIRENERDVQDYVARKEKQQHKTTDKTPVT